MQVISTKGPTVCSWVLLLGGYQSKKRASTSLLLHLGTNILYNSTILIYFHHHASVTRCWAHSHSYNTFANVSLSLPAFPMQMLASRPATKGNIKLSPLSPPCQHMDSTTQHNSKTSLTFTSTSRNI